MRPESRHRSFHIGEARGAHAKTLAGWEWSRDGWTDIDTDPLFAEALAVLGPHEDIFARCQADGAETYLSISGFIYGEVITTPEEADRKRIYAGEPDQFRPFFTGDRSRSLSARNGVPEPHRRGLPNAHRRGPRPPRRRRQHALTLTP